MKFNFCLRIHITCLLCKLLKYILLLSNVQQTTVIEFLLDIFFFKTSESGAITRINLDLIKRCGYYIPTGMASVYTINVDYFEEYCLKTVAKIFISLYPCCRYYRIASVYIKLYYTVLMSFDTFLYFK